ncbi:MAG: hypothetical protein ACPLW6_00400 [Desulfurella sp.]|uniref:Uncharacterized protein n=1 Tax=Desulfurella multipotens TaxID=79269 RepID=A0A1G6IU97_9BACT|nr:MULTISPECIES: hypothetical protein [Desulfurella]AHF98208.1 hypothetical protein DESACE_08675 [Desulfurella acetivorans A63]SDC09346.1 hypothetical protein SAMN05660835_00299 [Desulfurella multipotens]
MKLLLVGILIVLVLPYILQFFLKLKLKDKSDFQMSLGGCFSSGFDVFG